MEKLLITTSSSIYFPSPFFESDIFWENSFTSTIFRNNKTFDQKESKETDLFWVNLFTSTIFRDGFLFSSTGYCWFPRKVRLHRPQIFKSVIWSTMRCFICTFVNICICNCMCADVYLYTFIFVHIHLYLYTGKLSWSFAGWESVQLLSSFGQSLPQSPNLM